MTSPSSLTPTSCLGETYQFVLYESTCINSYIRIHISWPMTVADTKLKMSWQFVSARADIYQIFRSAYVEIYYGMGVHTHRYPMLILSCSGFVMFWWCDTHTHTTPTRIENTHNSHMNSAPQHHSPMPPTKAMGAIPQNHRSHPTATP